MTARRLKSGVPNPSRQLETAARDKGRKPWDVPLVTFYLAKRRAVGMDARRMRPKSLLSVFCIGDSSIRPSSSSSDPEIGRVCVRVPYSVLYLASYRTSTSTRTSTKVSYSTRTSTRTALAMSSIKPAQTYPGPALALRYFLAYEYLAYFVPTRRGSDMKAQDRLITSSQQPAPTFA